ncbi:MAG: hypothetical protein ACE5GE_01145 [Phycisphaerae bacterium]
MDTSSLLGWRLLRHAMRNRLSRRLLKACPPGVGLLLLGGCVSAGAIGGAALIFLLTGFFLTNLQASFAATANSYRFTEFAAPRLGFNSSNSNANLGSVVGPLPGFHLVIINLDNDKALVSAQAQDDEPQVFQTDFEIEFGSQPTVGGVVRECRVDDDGVMDCNGAEEFPLADFYDIDNVSASVRGTDEPNRFAIRIEVQATGVEAGEALDYALELDAGLSADGQRLTGTLGVFRTVTFPGQEPIVIESSGQILSGTKISGSATEGAGQPAGESMTANQPDPGDAGPGGADDPAGQDPGGQGSSESAEVSIVELCPSVPADAIDAIDSVITCCDFEGFDIDQDGLVTTQEVRGVIDPAIEQFGIVLPDSAAGCVAGVVNS